MTVYANSAEPPNLVIICVNCPDDLELTADYIDAEDGESHTAEPYKEKTLYGTFFRFFYHFGKTRDGLTVNAVSQKKSFSFKLEEPNGYHTLYTLDFKSEKLTEGKPSYYALLVFLRLALTLIIEGAIFYVFKYRTKKSWLVFLITNLITQGFLNLVISASSSIDSGAVGYAILTYLILEPLIFIVEMIVFGIALNERKRGWGVLCAFLANLASLIIGGVVIAMLPV